MMKKPELFEVFTEISKAHFVSFVKMLENACDLSQKDLEVLLKYIELNDDSNWPEANSLTAMMKCLV